MNVYGQLIRAQLEVKTSDHVGTIPGMVWFHNTEKRIKFSEGTNVVSVLANDGKAVIGTNGTASNNIRLNRSAAATLQIVPGNDVTAEGTDATSLGKLSARIESYSTAGRPAFGNQGRQIYNSDTGLVQIDTGTEWADVGGGSGSQITNVPLGEPILATDIPAAVHLAAKQAFVVTSSNNKIDFNEGAGAKAATVATGTYRYDNSYERAKLHAAIKAALEAPSGVTGVYTVSFDSSTRKITIASTVSHSLLNSTGTNHLQSICVLLLGFSGAGDTSSTTSHVADNAIDATVSKKLFALKTDASYAEKSRGYQGVVDSVGAQYINKNVKKNTTITGYSGLTETDELFTAKGSITISALNNKIDFTEGGAELHATVASGEYIHDGTTDHGGLSTAIKSALQSAGSGTYTVTYDNDTDLVTVVKSTGTFTLKFLTGTNNAVSIDTTLGYTHTDKTGSLSYTGQNALALRGRLLVSTSSKVTQNSVFGGFAQDTTHVHATRSSTDKYVEVVNLPGDFLATPDDVTPGYNIAFGDMASNASGQAVRCWWDTTTAPEVLHFQYRTSPNAPWQNSASTFSPATDLGLNFNYDDGTNSNIWYTPRVVIDDNGKAFCGVTAIWNATARTQVRGIYSNDAGVTWTKSTGSSTSGEIINDGGTRSFSIGFIRQRGNKVFMGGGDNGAGATGWFAFAEDTGSGYTTSTTSQSNPMDATVSMGAEIQYFPEQVGANQYRFVAMGRIVGSASSQLWYAKGDFSGITTIAITGTGETTVAMTREKNDGGNRIAILFGSGTPGTSLRGIYTNDVYNSGTLAKTEGADQNGGGTTLSFVNGFRSNNVRNMDWGSQNKMVMLSGRAWAVVQHNFSSVHRYTLWTASDVTTNTWTNLGEVLGSDSTNQQGEMRLIYVSAKNAFLVLWKRGTNGTTLTDNNTNGQIFERVIQLSDNGSTLSYLSAAQIDNGEALGTFQGGLTAASHGDGAGVSWLKSATIERAQKFA